MLNKIRKKFKILVIGPGRGGTSLVASLLDAHPKLNIGLEEFAFDYLLGKSLTAEEDSLEGRVEGFVKNCRKMAEAGKVTWGNKITTEQLEHLLETASREEVNQTVLREIIGRKKVIFVLRDGRSTVHSKMIRASHSYEEALARWKNSVDWLKLLKKNAPSFYSLRFEELLLRPEEQLRALCQYLNLPYAEEMMQGTESQKMLAEYRQKALDRQKAQIPPSALSYTDDMREELQYLGYL